MRPLSLLFALLATALPAGAQTVRQQPVGRIELDVGGGLFSGAALGAGDANLRANVPAPQAFRVFTADSRVERAPSIHLRAVVPLNRRFGIEAGMTWGRPEIRTSVTADVEGAASLTSVEQVDQYVFDGGVVWMLDGLRLGDRLVPFVSGGAGYLRQLHEGRTLIEHGQIYQAGGGIKYWLLARPRGFLKSSGVRGDVRLQLLRGGIAFDEGPRPHAAISGSVFVGF